jgi:DNA-binding XRE family transcriptional regulator
MNAQTITTPAGEELVVLPRSDYEALLSAAQDAADAETVREFRRKLAAGEEELLPSEFVDRILAGESPIRVWREHRGLTSAALASKAGIGQGFLSQIETGKREGTIETLKKIAEALNVTLDDLVG